MLELKENKHGVKGIWSDSGSHFGHEINGQFVTNIPIFVPECCLSCQNLDSGEYGDFGTLLAGPVCNAYVWFPTRKGTCGKQRVK